MHQEKCAIDQYLRSTFPVNDPTPLRGRADLHRFRQKHQSSISELACQAVFRFYRRPYTSRPVATSREREDALVIYVRTRPNAQDARPETRFYALDARLETLDFIEPPELREEMREKYRGSDMLRATGEHGPRGVVYAVLYLADPGSTLRDIIPVLFNLNEVPRRPAPGERDWKELLLKLLNDGIVI